MANVDKVCVKVITTEEGDRIGLLYDEDTKEMVSALKLNSEQELDLIENINIDLTCCDGDCEGCDGCDEGECDGDCENCESREFCEDMEDNTEDDDKDLKKTLENLVDAGIKQAQDIGKFMKEQGENIASKVNKEDIETMLDELKSNTETLIEKNKELINKYAPTKDDLKKVLDKVSSHASTFMPHNNETLKQKGINVKLFKALETENDNITVCLKVFNGVGEDALKGLTTVYCKVNGKFTNPYGVFTGEDDQLAWEANHMQQIGEVLSSIDYTKLKK